MADKKKGYVPIYRSIQDHWIWSNNEPFSRGQAWIDLLMLINHKEETIRIGNRLQVVKAGQRWTSYKQLGARWGWSYKRVLHFFELLRSDNMVYTDATPDGTLVTIVNWGNFAIQGKTLDTPNATSNSTSNDIPDATTDATTDATQTIMIKNDKRMIKNEKEKKRPPCPGEGWQWSDVAQKWIEPPAGGGEWQ